MPARSKPRFRGLVSPLVPVLGLLLCGARDAGSPAAPPLADGLSLERELHGGESHVYPVELQAGQFLRVIVQEEGIDVIVRLLDPRGAEVTGVDGIAARRSDEDLAALAPESGSYRVEIRAPKRGTAPERYLLKVEGPRSPKEEDGIRARAVRATWDAASEQGRDEAALRGQVQALAKAVPLWERLRETRRMAEAHLLLGQYRSSLADLDQAVEDFRESAALWGSLDGDEAKSWQVICLNSEGKYLKQRGHLGEARKRYEEALAIARGHADANGAAITLANLGTLESDQGDLRSGIAKLSEAVEQARKAGNRTTEITALNNLGSAYDQLAERQQALQHYKQVLDLARASGDSGAEALALNNLGQAYFYLGEGETSLKYLQRALELTRKLRERSQEGKTLVNLGLTYRWMGRYEEAGEAFSQALATSTDPETRTYALIHQSYLLGKLKQPARAVEPARQALELAKGFQDREIAARCALGVAYRDAGDLTAAREELARALSLAHDFKDRSSEAEIGLSLARAELMAGERIAAVRQVHATLELLESFRSKIFDQRLRASFLASNQSVYELYIEALMPEGDATEPLVAEALQVSERARARSLLDILTESGADVREGAAPALVEREHRLREELNSLDSYRFKLLTEGSANAPKLAETERRLEDALDRYRQAQTDLQASSPAYAALTQPRPLSPAEIQSQVLDGEALLLEYSLGAKRSFLWVVTPGSVQSFELAGRDRIEDLARRYYQLLTARNQQPAGESPPARKRRVEAADAEAGQVGRDLSDLILAPAGRLLGDRPLLIVADGALQYIPFAALPAPSSGAPLMTRHEVVSLPSASALAALRRETRGRPRAPKALAIFADPVFQPGDSRLTGRPGKPARIKLAATRGGWSPPEERQDGDPGGSFQRLPSSLKEAQRIAALVPADQLFLALGFQASRAAVLQPDLARYRNLHFATHGVLDSRRPELSKLVLSLYDEQGRPQDGFLRLNDIYNLHLDADLVVLSACQTALGQEVRGEGLIGLTRGFMYAGAARVLASLWSVEDRATADLMTTFYRGMLRDQLPPAAALRKAQLEMAKKPGRQSPYYWAGFSLQGEWR